MALIARMAVSAASKLLVRPALVPVVAARTITTSLAVSLEGASNDHAARMAKAQLEKLEAEAAIVKARRLAEEAEAAARTAMANAAAAAAGSKEIAARIAKEKAGGRAADGMRGVMIALVTALWVDWVWHENKDFIKWRMVHKLRACMPPPATRAPLHLFETAPLPLAPFLLNIVLGAVGCGKSTTLRAHVSARVEEGTPAMYVSIRRPTSHAPEAHLRSVADSVYEQIGFPTRRALLLELAPSVKGAFGVSVYYQPAEARRLSDALQWFIDVAREVSAERLRDNPEAEVPVLVFDELQDLVEDRRLAAAGGRFVFNELVSALAHAAVDWRLITVVVAADSARLVDALPSNADGNRYKVIMVPDPKDTDVKAALEERGYTPEDAAAIIALVGTRLRLLDDALQAVPPPPVATFKANAVTAAEANFATLCRTFVEGGKGTTKFRRLLERVEAAHAGGTPVDDESSLEGIDIAPVLFKDRDRHLRFQSDLHRQVWAAAPRDRQWCQETAS